MTLSIHRIQAWALAAAVGAALLAGSADAQAYKPPRNGFGQPDFSGTWTNASLTQLERPPQVKSLVITPAEARMLEAWWTQMRAADTPPSDPKAGAPDKGADPGGYNTFWMDPGTKVGSIRGELRSSWLIEPADGRLPYSPEGRRRFMADVVRIQGNADGPEVRQLAERCLLGFGSTAGPPMMNVLYNNTYQIQQDRDHLVILVEMDHDARIVQPAADAATCLRTSGRGWATAVGWWEGDTLVVGACFNPGESLRPGIPTTFYVSEDAKVTERFTRLSPTQIFYEFKVEDPKALQPGPGGARCP